MLVVLLRWNYIFFFFVSLLKYWGTYTCSYFTQIIFFFSSFNHIFIYIIYSYIYHHFISFLDHIIYIFFPFFCCFDSSYHHVVNVKLAIKCCVADEFFTFSHFICIDNNSCVMRFMILNIFFAFFFFFAI